MLRKSVFNVGEKKDSKILESHCGTLPSRLYDWRLSEDMRSFAYGGDEVDLSVWNTELAFGGQTIPAPTLSPSKKRKRNDDLFPGEIWRARNVRYITNFQYRIANVFLLGSQRSFGSTTAHSDHRVIIPLVLCH